MADEGITGFAALTAGDAQAFVTPGELFIVNCTVAGNVTVIGQDGSSHVIPVAVGYSAFPYRVKRVMTTGTTATATYANGMRPTPF